MSDETSNRTGVARRSLLQSMAIAGVGTATMGTASAAGGCDRGTERSTQRSPASDRTVPVSEKPASDTSNQTTDMGEQETDQSKSSDYEIGVWLSEGIVNWSEKRFGDPWRAQMRAKTYIEKAFGRSHVPYTVSVKTPEIDVPFNGGNPMEPYRGQAVCSGGSRQYEHPLEYFKEWLPADCTEGTPATHANVLLFGGGGGGLSYVEHTIGTYAGGKYIARVPAEYKPFAKSHEDHLALSGMLHEIGHNLITGEPEHHQLGALREREHGDMLTVMGNSDATNYCGDAAPADQAGRELTYSRCALSYFKSADNS